jgi:hypothetical protein
MLIGGLCEWCVLGDRIDQIFNHGPVDVQALKERLCGVARPDSMIIWLYNDEARDLLGNIAAGRRPLTHTGLDGFPKQRVANHLRGLLIESGLLETRNESVALFDRWILERFPPTPTPQAEQLLRRFARWHQRPGLVSSPGSDSRCRNRCQEMTVAAAFLTYLHGQHEPVETLTQRSVDEWWASPPTTRRRCRPFLKWLLTSQTVSPKIQVPIINQSIYRPLSQSERLHHLARMLDPDTAPLQARTAGIFLLLLAQPFTKTAALTLTDITVTNGETMTSIGIDPTPIPEPFAAVLQAQARNPNGRNTATNPQSPWLFPGRNAGKHISENALRNNVRDLGIDLRAARTATLEALITECPPAVVADMLDYNYSTVDKHAQRIGASWSRYASLKSTTTEQP